MIPVAVGVICDDQERILISRRLPGRHLAGYWEFPGGKIESNETTFVALQRELAEELGLHIISAEPLQQIRHEYAEKTVLLDVYLITEFSGLAQGREGQQIAWVPREQLSDYNFPQANQAILQTLATDFSLR